MKRIFCALFLFALLFSLCSCNYDAPKTDEYETTKTGFSKDYVAEFMELLGGETEGSGLASGFVIDEEHCYNVTPMQVAVETNMKIFKFSDSCASFVMLDNEIYELCLSFGGLGFVNAVPCDFDGDGNKDLLVASSWGSGIHNAVISVFNSVSKKSTVIYNTPGNTRDDLIIKTSIAAYSSKNPDNIPTHYEIYTAEIEVNNDNFADLSIVPNNNIGSIVVENGVPVFKPHQ